MLWLLLTKELGEEFYNHHNKHETMTDLFNLAEEQFPSLDFDRERFLQKWLIQSRPHMGASSEQIPKENTTRAETSESTEISTSYKSAGNTNNHKNGCSNITNFPVFFLMTGNGHKNATSLSGVGECSKPNSSGSNVNGAISSRNSRLINLGRKPKLRRFNSHDSHSNMFSVADFENARLLRRNEIEMKQRLQGRMRSNCIGISMDCASKSMGGAGNPRGGASHWYSNHANTCSCPLYCEADCFGSQSKISVHSTNQEPIPADIFFNTYSVPTVVRISYNTKFSNETMQSSSSNGSSTANSHSSASVSAISNTSPPGISLPPTGSRNTTSIPTGSFSSNASSSGNVNQTNTLDIAVNQKNTHNGNLHETEGELFLLYKFIKQRRIYQGYSVKTALTNRKKAVLIPQEFPGYFSLVNDKGLPTATQYTSLIQLVRERVFKFISVDNIPAFAESQSHANTHSPPEGCFPIYTSSSQNRPQYTRTTARAGEVYRLIAVFEDGKQDHSAVSNNSNVNNNARSGATCSGQNKIFIYGREKEKGRYAQLINDGRQVFYVPLSTKGKFYEVEPGIPIIFKKTGLNDANKKINPDCVHRIAELITPQRKLPLSLRYIAGPNASANGMPENLNIVSIAQEKVCIACPMECGKIHRPLHLRKLNVTKEMTLLKFCLGFDNEKSMWSDTKVQSVLKFCQFNCDKFLQTVEVETFHRSDCLNFKQRGDGLKLLKPLQLPKLLRREKTAIPAHEKEDSIIFFTKTDLANLEVKEESGVTSTSSQFDGTFSGNRISAKMKVFQPSKKKWFRKQNKHTMKSMTSIELDVQVKRMSMERYADMSKLLQARFGDRPSQDAPDNNEVESHVSESNFSDTETTALSAISTKIKKLEQAAGPSKKRTGTKVSPHYLQKSVSLQDITISKRKIDLLADNISEVSIDVAENENITPVRQATSFITEKLYNEFHVRTRQYSKSSSSLHQLLHFSLPQKLQINDQKRTLTNVKQNRGAKFNEKPLDFLIATPNQEILALSITHAYRLQNESLALAPNISEVTEDELPYSSVRDSLVESIEESTKFERQAPAESMALAFKNINYTKENLYAEICHEASAMGGVPSYRPLDSIAVETDSTQISPSDDFGDYASLTQPSSIKSQPQPTTSIGNAISRVQITCPLSAVSYHTVYLGDQPLREQNERGHRDLLGVVENKFFECHSSQNSADCSHITTVELEGHSEFKDFDSKGTVVNKGGSKNTSNIYNTLK